MQNVNLEMSFITYSVINILLFNLSLSFLDYEISRQIQILESGGVIENETRSFDVEDKYVHLDF